MTEYQEIINHGRWYSVSFQPERLENGNVEMRVKDKYGRDCVLLWEYMHHDIDNLPHNYAQLVWTDTICWGYDTTAY